MRRIYKVVVAAATLILMACSHTPKVVYLPVYSCPDVALPQEPKYKLEELTQKSSYDEIAKYWNISMIQCKSYAKELETILKGYKAVAGEGLLNER